MSVTLIPETTDEARDLFADSGLTYADLDCHALDALVAFLDIELARCRLEPATPCQSSMRMRHRRMVRKGVGGGVEAAELFVRAHYFDEREAVTFERNGFVGIAGWADSRNVRPFLVAFGEWVEWLSKRKEGMA